MLESITYALALSVTLAVGLTYTVALFQHVRWVKRVNARLNRLQHEGQ